MTVQLVNSEGKVVDTAPSARRRELVFKGVAAGYLPGRDRGADVREALGRLRLAGDEADHPGLMIAYIWIWAGFAMVVIAAGLSAMPRDVLEAARTDGATEWQVFRRVTVPLLAPVLSVVFITMIINVLKIFDLVITLAPGRRRTPPA